MLPTDELLGGVDKGVLGWQTMTLAFGLIYSD